MTVSLTVAETVLTGWIYDPLISLDAFFALLTEILALAEAVTFFLMLVGGFVFSLDGIFNIYKIDLLKIKTLKILKSKLWTRMCVFMYTLWLQRLK